MPDYLKAAAAFRAKAAATPYPEEAKILLEKAEELEKKYGPAVTEKSTFTNDTTTTSRDGFYQPFHVYYGSTRSGKSNFNSEFWEEAARRARQADAERIAETLRNNQWKWNREYYDKDGTPRTQTPDEDDLIADEYKHDPDEDEDYDPEGTWYNAQ